MKFPSADTSRPFGPDKGFKLLARDAQHSPPTNPPKLPLGPKNPGRRNPSVLHPNRVKLPCAVVMGGIVATGPFGKLSAGSNQHALALFPASATELSPPMAHKAMFETVLNTGTSRPMRSDTT